MLKKPSIVYGRKRLEVNYPTYSEPELESEVPRPTIPQSIAKLSDKLESGDSPQINTAHSSNTNVVLYDSFPDEKEKSPPKKKKGRKAATTKKSKAVKTKSSQSNAKQQKIDPNVPYWARSTVQFDEYENYSLAVTMEKSKLEAVTAEGGSSASKENVGETAKLEEDAAIAVTYENPPIQHLASTPAYGLSRKSTTIFGSGKASPVVSPMSDGEKPASDCDIEAVGNAKLPTPKLPTGVHQYSLRPLSQRTKSFVDSQSFSAKLTRRRKAVFSLSDSSQRFDSKLDSEKINKSSENTTIQKSVRFADAGDITNNGDEVDRSSSKSCVQHEWSIPSIIEKSGHSIDGYISLHGISINMKELDLNEHSEHVNTELAGETDGLLSTINSMEPSVIAPAISVPPEEIVLDGETALGSITDLEPTSMKVDFTEPSIKMTGATPVRVSIISERDAAEQDDTVGDLVVASKTLRLPRMSTTFASPSRLADISMRRKSLLVHEVTVDEGSRNRTGQLFDDPDAFAKSRLSILTPVKSRRSRLLLTPLEKLLRACGQEAVMAFDDFFSAVEKDNCVKIGEGVSGEVFKISIPSMSSRVIKIIPVNGSVTFNDADQKTFADILAEVVVARKTSSFARAAALLHDRSQENSSSTRPTRSRKKIETAIRNSLLPCDETCNASPNFIAVNQIRVVLGMFPQFLVKLWDKFAKTKGSENDHPNRFDSKQHFLVFDSLFGGEPLENFKFPSAWQALSCFAQVAASLAVAETASSFEHRDLHWGNILVRPSSREKLEYRIGTKPVLIASAGYEVSIIDFTLSRCSEDGVVVFTNLSQDEGIFLGEGDFQFEVYRLMRKETGDNWAAYTPRTNIFWLWYLVDKLVNKISYSLTIKANTQHRKCVKVLKELLTAVQTAKSAASFVDEELIPRASNLLLIEK